MTQRRSQQKKSKQSLKVKIRKRQKKSQRPVNSTQTQRNSLSIQLLNHSHRASLVEALVLRHTCNNHNMWSIRICKIMVEFQCNILITCMLRWHSLVRFLFWNGCDSLVQAETSHILSPNRHDAHDDPPVSGHAIHAPVPYHGSTWSSANGTSPASARSAGCWCPWCRSTTSNRNDSSFKSSHLHVQRW